MDAADMEAQMCKDSKLDGKKEKYWHYISNEEEWDSYLEKAQHASFYLKLDLKYHFWVWMKLIKLAHFKQNESEILIDCLEKMIDSMPVGASTEFRHCICYLEAIYSLERSQKLSPVSAERLLKLTEKKLAVTYNKSSFYWDTIRNLEKKRELPDMIYKKKCIDTYKKQFDLPYMNMTPAFVECMGLLTNNADQEDKEVISSLFEKNKLEGQRITTDFWQCFDKKNHHIMFEEWISEMLDKSPQWNETAIALCEEAVVDEKESICYHFLLAKTLVRIGMSEPSSKDKLFKALKRGIHLGRSECENMMMMYFLDYAIQAASAHLSSKECLELMDDMIDQFDFQDFFLYYLASRKAIIFGLKAMVDNGKFPKEDVQKKFVEALEPVIQAELDQDVLELGKDIVLDFESKRIELIKLSLLVEKQLTETTWKEIFNKWEDICLKSSNPEVILQYTAFIRQHGTPVEVENAYLRALAKMNSINKSTDDCNYGTRRCELLLMNNLREFLAFHGGMTNVLHLLNDLSKNLAVSSKVNKENYYLDCHPQINEEHVALLVFDYTPIIEDRKANMDSNVMLENGSTQYSDSTYDVVPVTSEMERLTVEQQRRFDNGFPVFLSNMHFKATKNDIVEAFKTHSLDIVRIKMKMSPKNHNYGFAVVEFSSLEQAKYAVSHCDHIEILGRKTFVSEFRERKIYSSAPLTPRPTVLNITDLPKEWNNPERIENALLPYGHIKSVEVNDEAETARVEYYMPEDLEVGFLKLEEMLAGTGTVIRKGFAGRQFTENKSRPTIKSAESQGHTKKIVPTPITLKHSKNKIIKKEFNPKIATEFLPRQIRQQMKKKLDCTTSDTEAGSSSQSSTKSRDEELGPSREKKIKVEPTSQSKNLTNDDFREMITR